MVSLELVAKGVGVVGLLAAVAYVVLAYRELDEREKQELHDALEEFARTAGAEIKRRSKDGAEATATGLTSRTAKTVYVSAILTAIAGGVLYLSWRLSGLVDTIVYAFLFLVGVSFIPTTILFLGPSFPRSFKAIFGKLHFMLGQIAFGTGYLVQRTDKWEMCPGSKDRVFIDDEWHEIDGGQTNFSVLGWKRFGVLRYKTEETLKEERVDNTRQREWSLEEITNASTTELVGDGGNTHQITRGGYTELMPDMASLRSNEWLIDLKKVYSKGLKKIGDIDLIEKAEEIQMRKEAKSSRAGGWEPVIGSIVGLIIGVATGYVLLGGV